MPVAGPLDAARRQRLAELVAEALDLKPVEPAAVPRVVPRPPTLVRCDEQTDEGQAQ